MPSTAGLCPGCNGEVADYSTALSHLFCRPNSHVHDQHVKCNLNTQWVMLVAWQSMAVTSSWSTLSASQAPDPWHSRLASLWSCFRIELARLLHTGSWEDSRICQLWRTTSLSAGCGNMVYLLSYLMQYRRLAEDGRLLGFCKPPSPTRSACVFNVVKGAL